MKKFGEKNLDVLQNIEFGIIEVYRADPSLLPGVRCRSRGRSLSVRESERRRRALDQPLNPQIPDLRIDFLCIRASFGGTPTRITRDHAFHCSTG